MDRITAECCLKALWNVRALNPGIETVSSLFEIYLRVACLCLGIIKVVCVVGLPAGKMLWTVARRAHLFPQPC